MGAVYITFEGAEGVRGVAPPHGHSVTRFFSLFCYLNSHGTKFFDEMSCDGTTFRCRRTAAIVRAFSMCEDTQKGRILAVVDRSAAVHGRSETFHEIATSMSINR